VLTACPTLPDQFRGNACPLPGNYLAPQRAVREDIGMETLARAESERGELVLRRRFDDAVELRVNGVFVMDTLETSSERLLARAALDSIGPDVASLRVLIGGLGLGFTLHEVLDDDRVTSVVVAEIEPDLVGWHRDGVVPAPFGRSILDDSRVTVEIGDVRACVDRLRSTSVDLVLLDVDNGPGFLVYDSNATIYASGFMRNCARVADVEHGVVAIWSASAAESLMTTMTTVFDHVDQRAIPVTLGTRETTYHLYLGSITPHDGRHRREATGVSSTRPQD
jgi:spermidine synthase